MCCTISAHKQNHHRHKIITNTLHTFCVQMKQSQVRRRKCAAQSLRESKITTGTKSSQTHCVLSAYKWNNHKSNVANVPHNFCAQTKSSQAQNHHKHTAYFLRANETITGLANVTIVPHKCATQFLHTSKIITGTKSSQTHCVLSACKWNDHRSSVANVPRNFWRKQNHHKHTAYFLRANETITSPTLQMCRAISGAHKIITGTKSSQTHCVLSAHNWP